MTIKGVETAVYRTAAGAVLALLAACAQLPAEQRPAAAPADITRPAPSVYPSPESVPLADTKEPKDLKTEVYRGTGVMVRPPATPEAKKPVAGEVVLNFENADLREVIKVILGDMMGENFVIDPQVRGAVTVQTSRPLSKDALLPVLETLLRTNGAALLRTAQGYQIRPLTAALQGTVSPQLSRSTPLPPGYAVQVVPLRYVGVRDIQKLLEPFAPPGSIIRADEARNLLVLAGTGQELANLVDTIRTFDVDWLAGMSVGMFPLDNVEAKALVEELDKVFGDQAEGPLAGVVRMVPLERLNALLVVSSQPRYLDDVRTWIARLDRTTGAAGTQIYVYNVQNGKAEHLAEVLGQLFGAEGGRRAPAGPELAPGLAPAEIGTPPYGGPGGAPTGGMGVTPELGAPGAEGEEVGAGAPTGAVLTPSTGQVTDVPLAGTDADAVPGAAAPRGQAARGGRGLGGAAGGVAGATLRLGGGAQASIVADKDNNALVILATPADYNKIEAAIRRLDVIPRQVLIEATIVEVTLTGALQYGLQWFFTHDVGQYKGFGLRDLAPNTNINSITDPNAGFTYAIVDAANIIHALLTNLASKNKTNVLSSPQLMVLDNQTANIKVGNQIPVTTSITQSSDVGTTQAVQYKDTGVLLEVTPRVNVGGLVTLELSQEVTTVGNPTPPSNNLSFFQRTIQTNIAVQSGQTIVLGGLITDTKRNSKSGVPILYDMPVIGGLFGTTDTSTDRTELIVLITPRVVRDQAEARQVTEELKQKLRGLAEPLEALKPIRRSPDSLGR